MDSAPTVGKVFKYMGIFILVVGIAVGLYYGGKAIANKYYNDRNNIPTPENNARIAANQSALNAAYYNTRQVQPISELGTKPEDRTLINYNMLGCRIAGYMGPTDSGVFKEAEAVQYAIKAGCRVFMLPIGTMQSIESPVLVVRNQGGDKISNNVGSVLEVCKALAQYAPLNGARAEPLIVILYFEALPGKNPYDPTAVKFMKDVAAGLAPLRDKMLGMTPQGDYRRQGMQDMLFLRDRADFDGKVIIMTNADTKAFREPTFRADPELDLDLMVHARLFAETSKNLGITGRPDEAKVSTPRLETYDYFIDIPDANLPAEIAKSKVQWTVAMSPNVYAEAPKGKVLKQLLDERGVSCLMVDVCSNPAALFNATDDNGKPINSVMSKGYFELSGFRLKPEPLRYKRPEPVKLQDLNVAADARGGAITSPKV
jgi:hypothetical protein